MSELTKREQIAAMIFVKSVRPSWPLDPKDRMKASLERADDMLAIFAKLAEIEPEPDARDARIAELEAALRKIILDIEGGADLPAYVTVSKVVAKVCDVAKAALKGATDES